MSHIIEGTVTEDHIGDPGNIHANHAKGGANHSDVRHGTLSSFSKLLFVRFRSTSGEILRQNPISMGIIPSKTKIQPTSNEQRNYTSSGWLTSQSNLSYNHEFIRRVMSACWAYCSVHY
jgi:hypothetical protein